MWPENLGQILEQYFESGPWKIFKIKMGLKRLGTTDDSYCKLQYLLGNNNSQNPYPRMRIDTIGNKMNELNSTKQIQLANRSSLLRTSNC